MSLRAILVTAMLVIGLSAVGAALSLVVIAAYMHQAIAEVTAATESVHAAEEMEVDLLVHDRVTEPFARAKLEGQLRGGLLEIRQYVDLLEEEQLFSELSQQLEIYLTAHDRASQTGLTHDQIIKQTSAELEAAFLAIEDLVHHNVEQARATAARAALWDRNATYFGVAIGVLLVLVVGAVLLWLRRFAFRWVLELEQAMRQFASGNKTARAPVRGPSELREIASGFNDMVGSLERQHDNQLAFLAGIVHDLRNPLSVLKLSGALASPERPAPSPEIAGKALLRVKRQAERLERMLEDLLDSVRIEAGHLELRCNERDLREIASDVVEMFRDSSPDHTLDLDLPGAPVKMSCDSLRIEQVITNLVSNAIKYSPQGSAVKVSLTHSDGRAVLEVSDTGVGIATADLAHIFEPFRRAGASRHQVPGAGLGLFVVRRIAEAHGGKVEVESSPGVGTTFRVQLPLAAAAAAA
jgi:two-component system, OmpR family, sensor histidine kinase MtrB